MEFKKNIVLTATTSNGIQKGVLSYIKNGKYFDFEFKGINFVPKDRILGVYIDDNLYKYDLNGKVLSFSIEIDKPYLNNVSVVILDRQNMLKPFLWGTQLLTENDFILNRVIEEVNIKTKNENFYNLEQNEDKTETVSEVKNFSFSDNLSSIEDRFEQNKKIEDEEKEIDKIIDLYQDKIDEIDKKEDLPEFYSMIAEQVEKILETNPTEKILEEIIPDSKFVNVPKANGDSYIFGLIYEDNIPKYICYGERGKFSEERPEHLKSYYQWLPIDVDNVSGDGYFMMYQDAKTGKNLEMTVI